MLLSPSVLNSSLPLLVINFLRFAKVFDGSKLKDTIYAFLGNNLLVKELAVTPLGVINTDRRREPRHQAPIDTTLTIPPGGGGVKRGIIVIDILVPMMLIAKGAVLNRGPKSSSKHVQTVNKRVLIKIP